MKQSTTELDRTSLFILNLKRNAFLVLLVTIISIVSNKVIAQTVSISHRTQRFVGDVSEIDRSKFFVLHQRSFLPAATVNALEPLFTQFNIVNGNNLNPASSSSINGGVRTFFGPAADARSEGLAHGTYRAAENNFPAPRNVIPGVVWVERLNAFFPPRSTNISLPNAANFVRDYFATESGELPEYYEPYNEPDVRLGDHTPSTSFNAAQQNEVWNRSVELTRIISNRMAQNPNTTAVKVIGPANAFPQFEQGAFGYWNTRQKVFIDEMVNSSIDGISFHTYDAVDGGGVNSTAGSFRSGSNNEALFDLQENYSQNVLNEIRPFVITEYGNLVPEDDGSYNNIDAWQNVRSCNSMMFSFLEREHIIGEAIPFIIINDNANLRNYRIFQPAAGNVANVNVNQTSPNINFYETWKDIKGQRILVESSDSDVVVQGFKDNNQVYVLIHSLEGNKNVNLEFLQNNTGLSNVNIKRVKAPLRGLGSVTNSNQNNAPGSISVDFGETVVLTYNYSNANQISNTNTVRSTKYYGTETVKQMVAGDNNLTINGLPNNISGTATLRLGVSRAPNANVNKMPSSVVINGTNIPVPANNYQGFNQDVRARFFGVVEIPIPNASNVLRANNNIVVRYANVGTSGNQRDFISSAVIQVEAGNPGGGTTGGGNNSGTACNASSNITGLTATAASNTSVNVAFTPLSGVNTYEIRTFNAGQFTGALAGAIAFSSGSSSPITVTGLTAGTNYTFAIRALCTAGGTSPLATVDGSTSSGGNTGGSTGSTSALFDFGTANSPLQSGYTRITPTSSNWTNTSDLDSRDRTTGNGALPNNLNRDFIFSAQTRIFEHAIANGTYDVVVTFGDRNFARTGQAIRAEGTSVVSGFDTAINQFRNATFQTTVNDGRLSLEFSIPSGVWCVTRVTIEPASGGGNNNTGTACNSNANITGLSATAASNTSVSVAFTPLTGVNTYEIRAFNAGTFNGSLSGAIAFASGSNSPISVTGLTAGTTYTFAIRALCTAGGTSPIATVDGSTSGTSTAARALFDFGTADSPLQSTYTRITPTSSNWTNTSSLDSRDRTSGPGSLPNNINRDFIFSANARTFEHATANGTYDVTVTFGDRGFARTGQAIRAEGTSVISGFNTAVNEFRNATFQTTVNDGRLSLEFSTTATNNVWCVTRVIITPVSAKSIANTAARVSMYPNPFVDTINIQMGNNTEASVMEIYNINGQLVYTKQVNANDTDGLNIDLSSVSSGLYFVRFNTINKTFKIIKK